MVARAAEAGVPVYGLTTGLGHRVVDRVDGHTAAAFSLQTLRGRAMAVGERLPAELSRAAMAVRCNGLCAGARGRRVAIADGLAALLNAGVHPCIPRIGSVGASDLCLLAHVGLTLIGEGEAELEGRPMASAAALARTGLAPVALGPKGRAGHLLELRGVAAVAALDLVDAPRAWRSCKVAAALSMEGFRANLARSIPGWSRPGRRRGRRGPPAVCARCLLAARSPSRARRGASRIP